MSLSEAKAELRSLHLSGCLHKRGFRWFKRWQPRWVILHGRLLTYYEQSKEMNNFSSFNQMTTGVAPRASIELNAHFLVMTSDMDGREWGLKVVPVAAPVSHVATPNVMYAELVDDVDGFGDDDDGRGDGGMPVSAPIAQADGDIWYFACETEEERDLWMETLQHAIALIRRCDDTRPTLSGMGDIHDHIIIGNVLGVGRFGVVREGANKHTKMLCAIKIINKKKTFSNTSSRKGSSK